MTWRHCLTSNVFVKPAIILEAFLNEFQMCPSFDDHSCTFRFHVFWNGLCYHGTQVCSLRHLKIPNRLSNTKNSVSSMFRNMQCQLCQNRYFVFWNPWMHFLNWLNCFCNKLNYYTYELGKKMGSRVFANLQEIILSLTDEKISISDILTHIFFIELLQFQYTLRKYHQNCKVILHNLL